MALSLMAAPPQSQFLKPVIETKQEQTLTESVKIVPKKLFLVSEVEGSNQADQKPKNVTIEDKVNLHAVLEAKENNKPVYYTNATNFRIRGKKIKLEQIKPWPKTKKVQIEWFKVEPTERDYSYVKSSNPITYTETEFSRGWEIEADVHPTKYKDQFPNEKSGIGVMRYKAQLTFNGQTLSTPGEDKISGGGISDKVVRVSFRPNTGSWVDHVFELFNTPYIWGSRTKQIDGQIGSDCADFALYGWRCAGSKLPYTWSYGLKGKQYTKNIVTLDPEAGNNQLLDMKGNEITFDLVKEGDVILYPRHIAVLYKDNGNNIFDCNDLVLHTLFEEPKIDTVCEAYGVPEEVLRWKKLK